MSRQPLQLGDLQLAVLRVLWERGEASVAEVRDALAADRGLATTTIATVLSRLERRGAVRHRKSGRHYLYRAEVTEPEVKRSMVASLTELLFDGDPAELVSHLVSEREVTDSDLERVRALLDADDAEAGDGGR